MKFVVLDLEMCQPSKKIFQIGAVEVDPLKGKLGNKYVSFANPGELPDEEICELCNVTPDIVQKARPLKEVLEEFWVWFSKQSVGNKLCAWGNDCHTIIKQSCDYRCNFDWPKSFDFKAMNQMFRVCSGLPYKGGLKTCMEDMGLAFTGVPHDALVDAENTALLMIEVFQTLSKGLGYE